MEGLKEIFENASSIEEIEEAVARFIEQSYVPKKDFDEVNGLFEGYKKEHQRAMKENAVDMAIMAAKGKNPKAIKALIDMESVTVNEDGSIEGIDIDAIKKSDSYLFEHEEIITEGTGFTKGAGVPEMGINNEIAKAMGIKK